MKLFTSVYGNFFSENPIAKQARNLVIYHIFIDRFAIGGKTSFKHAVIQSNPDSPGTPELII